MRFLWVFFILLFIFDFYVYRVLKYVLAAKSRPFRLLILCLYWVFSGVFLLGLAAFPIIPFESVHPAFKSYFLALLIGSFFSKLLACLFFLADDIRRGIIALKRRFSSKKEKEYKNGEPVSRSAFLSWLGLGVGASLLGTFTYGFTNKYNYQVRRQELSFKNLPDAFKGLKIVQISDIHVGSFHDKAAVASGIEQILSLNPDLIVVTGDLVNDHAEEMDNYKELFKLLRAPMGVYSILGNHDYGLYAIPQHFSEDRRNGRIKENTEKLIHLHEHLGWKLLMNDNRIFEKNGDKIALLGVENWGAKGNFPKYGKLEKAHSGTENIEFKILLSHDPSHWDAEVLQNYKDINLTLSGHTHGMQFGVETPGFKWSPVQYMYERWAGLYTEGNQKLYINRGFGFIGYPGRVGIMPEITEIVLS